MKILDLDMDYFIKKAPSLIDESFGGRLEEYYDEYVWNENEVRDFLEKHLGLTRENKIPGRIVKGHNESLFFWDELIKKEKLTIPFEVIHVDSHADLGLGYFSYKHIRDFLLSLPVEDRPNYPYYTSPASGRINGIGIGDYLLFAIAYRWIEKLTYCGNPNETCNDYIWNTLKNMEEKLIWDEPVQNYIQLLYNAIDELPDDINDKRAISRYIENSIKEPEVPFLIIPTIKDVRYNGDFDFAILAQSPNYTPASADYIVDVFKEYIEEV